MNLANKLLFIADLLAHNAAQAFNLYLTEEGKKRFSWFWALIDLGKDTGRKITFNKLRDFAKGAIAGRSEILGTLLNNVL